MHQVVAIMCARVMGLSRPYIAGACIGIALTGASVGSFFGAVRIIIEIILTLY